MKRIDKPAVFLLMLCLVLVAIEVLWASNSHPVFSWHTLAGFSVLIGLISPFVLALLMKAIGEAVVRQDPVGDDDD